MLEGQEFAERTLLQSLFELSVHHMTNAIVSIVIKARWIEKVELADSLLAVCSLIPHDAKGEGSARPRVVNLAQVQLDLVSYRNLGKI